MGEILTTEEYWFDTLEEAVAFAEQMRAERACDMYVDIDTRDPKGVKMVVGVGEAR